MTSDNTVSDICGYVTGVAVAGLRARAVRPVVDLQGAAGTGHLGSITVNIFHPTISCFHVTLNVSMLSLIPKPSSTLSSHLQVLAPLLSTAPLSP